MWLHSIASAASSASGGGDNLYSLLGIVAAGGMSVLGTFSLYRKRGQKAATSDEVTKAAEPVAVQTAVDTVEALQDIWNHSVVQPLVQQRDEAHREAGHERRQRLDADRGRESAERLADAKVRQMERAEVTITRLSAELASANRELAEANRLIETLRAHLAVLQDERGSDEGVTS